jgi:NAD(P)-dependent dehydrogenase (short-subunit alcohol dehydrogenase family)
MTTIAVSVPRSPSETGVAIQAVQCPLAEGGIFMAGMLEGKSALITGGGGGVGGAAALAFAREGANVAVADLMAEAAQETVGLVNRAGGQAMSLTGDITNAGSARALVESAVATFGRLDCAFNNAGIAPWQVEAGGMKTAEWSEESFDRMSELCDRRSICSRWRRTAT